MTTQQENHYRMILMPEFCADIHWDWAEVFRHGYKNCLFHYFLSLDVLSDDQAQNVLKSYADLYTMVKSAMQSEPLKYNVHMINGRLGDLEDQLEAAIGLLTNHLRSHFSTQSWVFYDYNAFVTLWVIGTQIGAQEMFVPLWEEIVDDDDHLHNTNESAIYQILSETYKEPV